MSKNETLELMAGLARAEAEAGERDRYWAVKGPDLIADTEAEEERDGDEDDYDVYGASY